MEWRADGEIGMVFVNGEERINDFAETHCRHGIETREWEQDNLIYYTDIWGNTWFRFKGLSQGGEIYEPAIREWGDLDTLDLPDLDNPDYYGDARELVTSEHSRFRTGIMPGWPFSVARYLRKMEQYFVDLIADRDRIDALHGRVTALLEKVIDRFGEAGVDGIMFFEDLGVQDRLLMSPEMWREIFRPLYERLTARAHQHGMKVIQHSCGFNWLLIDDLCGAGIDCLQFDQPMVYDLPELAEKLRSHRVGLYAPCDIQRVLPTGDRNLITSETRRLVETFSGGFIAKDYPDLHGIGVDLEWDTWAYDEFRHAGNR
jgi:hypothetical protein